MSLTHCQKPFTFKCLTFYASRELRLHLQRWLSFPQSNWTLKRAGRFADLVGRPVDIVHLTTNGSTRSKLFWPASFVAESSSPRQSLWRLALSLWLSIEMNLVFMVRKYILPELLPEVMSKSGLFSNKIWSNAHLLCKPFRLSPHNLSGLFFRTSNLGVYSGLKLANRQWWWSFSSSKVPAPAFGFNLCFTSKKFFK